MIGLNKQEKIIIAFSAVVLCFAMGIVFNKVYQPSSTSVKIYQSALDDLNRGDYSNSYYLFSKISALSDLKPLAIYHQAECARKIGDKESALKKYRLLFKRYPKIELSIRAKYYAAQYLVEDNPRLARKYFEQIIKQSPDSDYGIASEYYCGLITLKEYTESGNGIFPLSKKHDVEEHFRHYLKHAPGGRLAVNVIDNWLSMETTISTDDYFLMANSLFQFGEYPRVKELLEDTLFQESWVLNAQNLSIMGRKSEAVEILEKGFANYTAYVSEEDIVNAINLYFEIKGGTKFQIANSLNAKLSGKGQDYAAMLMCKYSASSDKLQCYKDYYMAYPESKYTDKALSAIFLNVAMSNDVENAKKIGQDYLNKHKNSLDAPMVMFWLGKLYERTRDYGEYMGIYKKVIETYPDNYYAYRAYLRLNHRTDALILDYMNPQPVEFPYKKSSSLVKKLVELQDYDMLSEVAGDDDFIKSWILYQEGNYSQSMLVGRNAMDKLEKKPDKYDLRWRLVYPIHYYDELKKYSDRTGNNLPLMLSITREESYFNPEASSSVGARGLMQIMPSTALEIANKKRLGEYNLLNPESNIKLGCYYYSYIKGMLSGQDISAVASYNGGIGAVTTWKKSLYYNDTDEFVEQIPYDETRDYVKKVFRSYWNYIRIYNGNS